MAARALGRVARLEDARAHEHALGAQLHHEGGVGRRGHAAGCEVHHRKRTGLVHIPQQLHGHLQLLRRLDTARPRAMPCHGADLAHASAHVAHGLHDVAGARLALGADHGGALRDAAQGLAQIPRAADEGHVRTRSCRCGRRRRPGRAPRSRRRSRCSMAWRICASAKWPMRHFAMTGMDTASWMPLIMAGSLMRDTPPAARMSAGMRSSAMTAQAPASSAIARLLGGGDVHDDAALEHLGERSVEHAPFLRAVGSCHRWASVPRHAAVRS